MRQLHRRSPTSPHEDEDEVAETRMLMENYTDRSPITAQRLLQNEPVFTGWAEKRSMRCLGLCQPRWQRRFFILSGSYLFRFADEFSSRPKGVPIPLHACSFEAGEDLASDPGSEGPCTFSVSTLRKEYVLRVETREDRDRWLSVLREAKQLSIKVRLGHANRNPKHAAADHAGDALFAKRIKEDANPSSNSHTMELSLMGGIPDSQGGGF